MPQAASLRESSANAQSESITVEVHGPVEVVDVDVDEEHRFPPKKAYPNVRKDPAACVPVPARLGPATGVRMFIGHHAVGFASKRFAPRTSLGWLMAAPLLLDLLWPIFLLLGLEHVRIDPSNSPFLRLDLYDYPWSHSLLMSLVWSVLFGGGYALVTRYPRGGLVIGAGVFSHWIFDFVVHRPDLPLYPGGPKVGLGLWNSTAGTIVVESVLFIIGLGLYLNTTKSRDRVGTIAFWAFVAFILLAYVSSIVGPPPPDWKTLAWVGASTWLLLFWVYLFDRHRLVIAAGASP